MPNHRAMLIFYYSLKLLASMPTVLGGEQRHSLPGINGSKSIMS
jgi:hypothetical protein